MSVLVTGCSGFLGEALSRRLLKEGINVVGVDIANPPYDLWFNDNFDFRRIDIRELEVVTLSKRNKVYDTIFHCAALVPITRSSLTEFIHTNTIGNVFAMALNSKKHVYISSSAIYGKGGKNINESHIHKPIENYGRSKVITERLI